jgi:iron complex outermembrane recepter protein
MSMKSTSPVGLRALRAAIAARRVAPCRIHSSASSVSAVEELMSTGATRNGRRRLPGTRIFHSLALTLFVGIWPAHAAAQSTRPSLDLEKLTIEDLMNIEITSASRKEQRLADVPAAISVITQDDIRRSGMTTVPELLRLVPGVQVAQINSNKWAVAVRGFNNLFADKLLVLVDGRTVYDRLNSAVFWESIDIPLDQIERIEVLRGPGGATWGANAVNGVISIVTKSAAETVGAAVTAGGGTFDGTHVSARYGATVGNLSYRLSSQWAGHDQSQLSANTPASDTWNSQTHGVRLDWTRGTNAVMVQGGATLASLRGLWSAPSGPVPAIKAGLSDRQHTEEYDALGRWTHRGGNGSSLQLQSFVDFRHNDDSVNPRQTQVDVDAQYHVAVATRHDLVVGAGYRFLDERTDGGFAFSIAPARVNETVLNAFAQDDVAVGSRVTLTLGAKAERDAYVGWSLQPTARVLWSVVPKRQQAWAAISRAIRTPSLGEVSGRYNFASFIGQAGLPVVVGVVANPAFQSEEVIDIEAGYRVALGAIASVDVTGFRGRYDNLKTSEPLAPHIESSPAPAHLLVPSAFGNLLKATTSGVEIAAHLTPVAWWRLDGSYSTFRLGPQLSADSRDAAAATADGHAPSAQWQTRSALSLPFGVNIDAMLFHAGALRSLAIDAYTRADVRLALPVAPHLIFSLVGQNLFDPVHAEFAGVGAIVMPTLVPRSARMQLAWSY